MSKEYDVVALGELLVDMAEGSLSDQGNMTFEACPGGAPCNVLGFLSRMGKITGFIGKVGDDFLGHMLADTIKGLNIKSDGLVFDKENKTTLAFVHKKPDGDRDFSFYRNPGADMMLGWDDVNTELIASSRIFHFGTLSMTHEAIRMATKNAVAHAKENGCLVSFDPNLREPLWNSLDEAKEQMLWGLNNCDVLKISDNEVEFLTGTADYEEGLNGILKMTTAKVVFMTLGPNGSIGYTQSSGMVRAEGVKVDSVVDTTGAGDTFMGSALNKLLERALDLNISSEDMKSILTYANLNASKITQVKGALKAMGAIDFTK